MQLKIAVSAFAVLAVIAVASDAFSCTVFGSDPEEFRADAEKPPHDESPPKPPELTLEHVQIGVETPPGTVSSCANKNDLSIRIDSPDESPGLRPDIGYRLEVVRGDLPPGLSLPRHPIAREIDGFEWSPSWIEPIQREVSFTLRAVAVDKWGRESKPSEPLTVQAAPDDETQSGAWSETASCSAVGLMPAFPVFLCLLGWRHRELSRN